MTDEQKAKNSTLSQAKNFIHVLKQVIHDIETKFESNEEGDQAVAVINALAMSDCLADYHSRADEIAENLQTLGKLKKENKLN